MFRRFRFLAGLGLVLLADDPAAAAAGGGGGKTPAPDPQSAPPGGGTSFTQADLDAAVAKALQARDTELSGKLKELTGHDTLDKLAEHHAKQKGEEAKLLDARTAERDQARQELAAARIESSITLAATAAGAIDPSDIHALLAGKAKFADGAVTVDGKPVAEAVKALLEAKPHLAKAGPSGGGTPQQGGGAAKALSRAEFEKLDAAGRMDFIKKGGKVV